MLNKEDILALAWEHSEGSGNRYILTEESLFELLKELKKEQAPAQDERLRAAFMEGYQQGIDSEFSDPEAAWNRSRSIHVALDLEQARPGTGV